MVETSHKKAASEPSIRRVPALRFSEFARGSAGVSSGGASRVRDAAAVGLEWEEKRLGTAGEIRTGTTPPTVNADYYGGIFPWVTPTDIRKGKDIATSAKSLSKRGLERGRFIPKDSLLVTCIASIGKNAVLRSDGSCNQQINAVIPNEENNVDFLYYLLEQKRDTLVRFAGSGGMQILNKNDFSNIRLARPSLPEQKKIADFLTAVDEWIGILREERDALATYKRGVMQRLFSPCHSREGGNLGSPCLRFHDENGNDFPDWEEKKLGEVFVITAGTSKSDKIDYEGDNIIVDMGGVSSDGRLIAKKRTSHVGDFLRASDLVMPKDDIGGGLIIGRVAMIPIDEKYVFGDHVFRLAIKEGVSGYYFHAINSHGINKEFRKKANGTAQLGLSKKEVANQKVPVPSLLEQKKIADFLTALDELITAKADEISRTEEWKKGLMQQMFV